jgi:hypothetical protein
VVVSYAPGSAREAKLVTRAVRSTVRSIAGFPPRPGPSDTSEDPDGYGIYGTMGHCAPAGHQVEGLVRGFPGGGSSPLRRMTKAPPTRGFRATRARQRTIDNASPEKPCENQTELRRRRDPPRVTGADWVTAERELAFRGSSGRLVATGPREPQGIVVAVDALGQVAGGHVLVALGGS